MAVAMGAAAETSIRAGLPVQFTGDRSGGFAVTGKMVTDQAS